MLLFTGVFLPKTQHVRQFSSETTCERKLLCLISSNQLLKICHRIW